MLSERFDNLLIRIGNPTLEHPVFYKCPVAIRFEIGGETPVYSDASLLRDTVVNSQYIGASLQRAKAIYSSLPQPPNLLRIDTHPNEDGPGVWKRIGFECASESGFFAPRTKGATDK